MLKSTLPVKLGFLFVRIFRFSCVRKRLGERQGGSRYLRLKPEEDTNNKEVPLDAR